MPEIMYDSQESVPEPFRNEAQAKDGKFVINVVPQTKLDEFRENNLALSRERDGFSSIIGRLTTDTGFDREKLDDFVTEITDLRGIKKQVEDGQLIKDTSLNEALETRTSEMRRQHDTQVAALTNSVKNLQTENDGLRQQVTNNIVDREITAAVGNERSGVRPDAVKAVIREAHDFFQVKDGKLIAMENGQIVYGTDGTSPMTPLEWIKTRLAESSPYLFKDSSGGGAQGGNGLGGLTPEQLAQLPAAERIRLYRANQG